METESINDGMPSVILEAIKAHKLLEKILNKALFLPAENVQEILKSTEGRKNDGKMVMQMVTTLQTKVIYKGVLATFRLWHSKLFTKLGN